MNRFFFLWYVFFALLCTNGYAHTRFLILTDVHYGPKNSSSDGEDTGPILLKEAVNKIESFSEQVDFILVLGDLPTHKLFSAVKKGAYEQVVFQQLFKADHAFKPMFYSPGNNDALLGNYQAFERNGMSALNYATNWDGACLYCKDLLIDKSQMLHEGYYSTYVLPNNKDIILIVLNTAPFVNLPVYALPYPDQQLDASLELNWLEQQLKQHKAKQLLIAMHVPPGWDYKGRLFWHKKDQTRFISLLERYASSYGQISLFSGHTHMDELRKIHLTKGTNIYNYSTPAISAVHHNNPALKVVDLNKSMRVSNYTIYYTNNPFNWSDNHYQAMGNKNAIFPKCTQSILAACLDSQNVDQVCNAFEEGLFSGVKSNRVPEKVCFHTYLVNPS